MSNENTNSQNDDWITFLEWAAFIGWMLVVVLIFS